jgi:hypothetical protein
MLPIFRRGVVPQQLIALLFCVGVLITLVAARNIGVLCQLFIGCRMVNSVGVVAVCSKYGDGGD